jgi:microcystin-dependent protein
MDPFIAEIRIFPFDFAPKGWAFCNGQVLPISQNVSLFTLLGTLYGGDGTSNFALPNLQGSTPLGQGQGPGLSSYDLGQAGGTVSVALLESEIPNHTHQLQCIVEPADSTSPAGNSFTTTTGGETPYVPPEATMVPMADTAVRPAGSSQEHNNMQPYLPLNFCIALQGVYPPRT